MKFILMYTLLTYTTAFMGCSQVVDTEVVTVAAVFDSREECEAAFQAERLMIHGTSMKKPMKSGLYDNGLHWQRVKDYAYTCIAANTAEKLTGTRSTSNF
jgi:hypothetical protein